MKIFSKYSLYLLLTIGASFSPLLAETKSLDHTVNSPIMKKNDFNNLPLLDRKIIKAEDANDENNNYMKLKNEPVKTLLNNGLLSVVFENDDQTLHVVDSYEYDSVLLSDNDFEETLKLNLDTIGAADYACHSRRGRTGAIGATGATGAAGLAGSGAIIPFATGPVATMTTVAAGTTGIAAFGFAPGFGFSTDPVAITVAGTTVDLTGVLETTAFTMPRDGTLTSIAANFTAAAALALPGTSVTVQAQVYTNTNPANNIFTAVPGAIVTLTPPLAGINQNSSGLVTGLNIPLAAGTRVLLVFSSTATGTTLVTSVTGTASAGLGIN